jgi:hypothetical protein
MTRKALCTWQLIVATLILLPRMVHAQGNPLGPEFRVNTYTTSAQIVPAVASDASGNFVVVWSSSAQDGSGYGVFGQRYASAGDPLGPEFQVNTYTTGLQFSPSVAGGAAGSVIVVWYSALQDGSGFGIVGRRYSNAGTPLGPEFTVNTYTTGGQVEPMVASDGVGNFVVAWNDDAQDGSGWGVSARRYSSTGTPLGPEFRVNTSTTGHQLYPSVAAESGGNFVVVWSGLGDGSDYGIFGQRYSPTGAPSGPEFRVNTYTSSRQWHASVAANPAGGFTVVWASNLQDGSSYGIFGQRYAAGGAPLGPEFRVNTYTSSYQLSPAVAADASGDFVVIWSSDQDGSGRGIFGQRYLASGAPFGPEFRINSYTIGTQLDPRVAVTTAGDFVVVWASGNDQDGSGYGIFGQRFAPIVPVELMQVTVE